MMATLAELEEALINADAAGDTEAAQVLADEVMKARQSAPKPTQVQSAPLSVDPTEGNSFLDNALIGAGKFFSDRALGVQQRLGIGDQEALAQEAADREKRDAPLMRTGGGIVGNAGAGIAATLPLMAVPGGASLVGNMLTGGLLGATDPTADARGITENEDVWKNVMKGEAGSLLGSVLAKGVGRVFSPETRPDAKGLMNSGVTLTPGQIMGGAAKRIEDGLTSVPFLGDAIKNAQRRSIEDFDRAAWNRALSPVGESLPDNVPMGRETASYVSERLRQLYDDVLPKAAIKQDQQFIDELTNLQSMISELPADKASQLNRIIENRALGKFKSGALVGESIKDTTSSLRHQATQFKSSTDPDQRNMGHALEEVNRIIKDTVSRQNPDIAPQIKSIDEAYANYVRPQVAAGMQGAKDGLFTPAQLSSAVRNQDKTVRHGGFARGEALMQDLSDTGQRVLNQTVPDSGTPFRMASLLLGGGAYALDPAILATGLGASALYTKQGQMLAQALLAKRPELLMKFGDSLKSLAPYSGTAGALLPLGVDVGQ